MTEYLESVDGHFVRMRCTKCASHSLHRYEACGGGVLDAWCVGCGGESTIRPEHEEIKHVRRLWCNQCGNETYHDQMLLLKSVKEYGSIETTVMRCCGCDSVVTIEDVYCGREMYSTRHPSSHRFKGKTQLSIVEGCLPSPDQLRLSLLIDEIYAAANEGAYRVCAMGIGAALEEIMISAVGKDHGSFAKNHAQFSAMGFLSKADDEMMASVIQLRHAAIHRGAKPDEAGIKLALQFLNVVVDAQFNKLAKARELAARIPARRK